MTISGSDRDPADNDHDLVSGVAHPNGRPSNGSFTRFHPQEFFGEDWHGHVPASGDWDRARVCPEGNPMTRPQDGAGEVFIERSPGTDTWRAAWMHIDERDVMIASELGPQSATLVQCISWAIQGAKPARVSINLLTGAAHTLP